MTNGNANAEISAQATRDRLITGYAALAVAIHVLESAMPSPLPGIKPGLANVITLIVLFRHGLAAAIWVAVLRILVAALLMGTFMTPTFLLSAAGGISALLALALAWRWNRWQPHWPLSAIGTGLLAAWAHMLGQFALAMGLFIQHAGLTILLPVLLTAALAFGLATGWLAQAVLERMPPPLAADRMQHGY